MSLNYIQPNNLKNHTRTTYFGPNNLTQHKSKFKIEAYVSNSLYSSQFFNTNEQTVKQTNITQHKAKSHKNIELK